MPEPNPPAEPLLLGTVHQDPQGYSRLRRFLDFTLPDCICVELSPFGWWFRVRHGPALRRQFLDNLRLAAQDSGLSYGNALKHPEILAIGRQIRLPFEYSASIAWAQKHPCRVVLVDLSRFSRRWIRTWPELISADNLAHLLRHSDPPPRISQRYDRASRRILHEAVEAPLERMDLGEEAHLWAERERYLARRVARTLRLLRPQRPLFVGGWTHLATAGPFPSLRDLLSITPGRCRLLHAPWPL